MLKKLKWKCPQCREESLQLKPVGWRRKGLTQQLENIWSKFRLSIKKPIIDRPTILFLLLRHCKIQVFIFNRRDLMFPTLKACCRVVCMPWQAFTLTELIRHHAEVKTSMSSHWCMRCQAFCSLLHTHTFMHEKTRAERLVLPWHSKLIPDTISQLHTHNHQKKRHEWWQLWSRGEAIKQKTAGFFSHFGGVSVEVFSSKTQVRTAACGSQSPVLTYCQNVL